VRNLLLIILLFFVGCSFGQLVTSTAQNPSSLVQNVLLGQGVTVSNISFSGSPMSIGSFTAAGTNLGIASGIVMTTGTVVNNGNGPHGPNNSSGSGIDNNASGSPQLSALIGGTATHNAAILQFDFVPYSDTVRFKYVFGSEEYPEYVGSSFNDVFAFFISGPGIVGGQQNIAKLANGQPVTINNVNTGSNSAFYVDNGNGSQAPFNGSANYIQYDGFTKVLEAVSKVQCGQTYHLIIEIADAGDGILDSGIFLEANSLNSVVPVEVDYALSALSTTQDNIMAEGCVSATITLNRNGNVSSSMTIPITVSGTATELVDYTDIPNSITFPAGQSQVQFTFSALSDALTEGIETIILTFPITDPCGNVTPIVVNLGIDDIQPVSVTVASAGILCPGDPLEVLATVTGGAGPYVYQWSTGESTSSIFVTPSNTAVYTVSVTDNCLNQTVVASGTVTVPVYPPLNVNETADIVEICPYIPAILAANATGGAGNYSYQWTATELPLLGNDSIQEVIPFITTAYTVEVTDQCGETAIGYVVYSITSPPLILTMSPANEICPGDSLQISVSPAGGYGQYYYSWNHNGDTTSSVWVSPTHTTSYTVTVWDDCRTFTVPGSTTITVVAPVADFEISSQLIFNGVPVTFHNQTFNGDSYQWFFGDGQSSSLVHPNNTYAAAGNYVVTLIATDVKGCIDSISKMILIEEEYYVYIPNCFTPDDNRFNNVFSASTVGVRQLTVKIFNRWGEMVYESDDPFFEWDGSYGNSLVRDGIYSYKINCTTDSNKELNFVGHLVLLR
jgi:gliding motility-associated-like protein